MLTSLETVNDPQTLDPDHPYERLPSLLPDEDHAHDADNG